MTLQSLRPTTRLYLIDLFRLPFLISIAWFHLYNMAFPDEDFTLAWRGTFSLLNSVWMRLFIPGGLVIIALSCFLFGYRGFPTKKFFRFMGLFAIGILLLFVSTSGGNPFAHPFFEWDIYHFLFVNFIGLYWIQKNTTATKVFGILGFVLLCLPIVGKVQVQNTLAQNIFFGDCGERIRGGWPLLPWSGLIWFFYFLGWASWQPWAQGLRRSHRLEWLIWPIVFFLSSPNFLAYYHSDIAAGFYCYVFQRTPIQFWSYFVAVLFVVRLALIPKFNEFLARQTWSVWVSNLQWNKNLALCYFVHLFYLSIITSVIPFAEAPLWVFDIFSFTTVPLTELFVRLAMKAKNSLLTKAAPGP